MKRRVRWDWDLSAWNESGVYWNYTSYGWLSFDYETLVEIRKRASEFVMIHRPLWLEC